MPHKLPRVTRLYAQAVTLTPYKYEKMPDVLNIWPKCPHVSLTDQMPDTNRGPPDVRQ